MTLFVIFFVAVSRVHAIHFAYLFFAVAGVLLPIGTLFSTSSGCCWDLLYYASIGTDGIALPLMLLCQVFLS